MNVICTFWTPKPKCNKHVFPLSGVKVKWRQKNKCSSTDTWKNLLKKSTVTKYFCTFHLCCMYVWIKFIKWRRAWGWPACVFTRHHLRASWARPPLGCWGSREEWSREVLYPGNTQTGQTSTHFLIFHSDSDATCVHLERFFTPAVLHITTPAGCFMWPI